MIKMIVTDLDGTLLRDDKTVSEHTKDVLRQCREAGVKIVFATGRGGSAVRLVPIELFDGYIINNGALAFAGGEAVYRRLVPYEMSRPLLLACDRHGLRAVAQRSGRHYANFNVSRVWPHILNFEVTDFSKLSIYAEKLYVDNCGPDTAAFIESHLPHDLYLTVSRDGLGMIMHKEATKARAIAELARHWGIAQEEIAAFGDDLNDIDMLEYAGAGVAMSNALDEVKAVADDVCLSNEEEGLSVWLREKFSFQDTQEGQTAVPSRPGADLTIEGLNVQEGVTLMGGSVENYMYVLSAFLQEAFEKIGKIKVSLDAGDLVTYSTYTHALKSAALYVGAHKLSESARELEMAGKRGDRGFIDTFNEPFICDLENVLSHISKAVKKYG